MLTFLFLLTLSSRLVAALSDFGTLFCLSQHCIKQTFSCLSNKRCYAALNCNRKCGTGPTSPGCNLLCQLTDGYENENYKQLLRCMSAHQCLPVSTTSDGICKAKRSDGLKDVTSLDDIKVHQSISK